MSRHLPPISAEALFEIELALAEPKFQGVPLGSTLGDVLLCDLFQGHGSWTIYSVLKSFLLGWYHQYFQKSVETNVQEGSDGRYLLTWLANMPKLRDLVIPVIEHLGGENCFVVGTDPNMAQQLPCKTKFICFSEIPRAPLKEWRREYDTCARTLKNHLVNVLKKHEVPGFVIPRLLDSLIVQSQLVMACGRFLGSLQPRAIISEYDRNIYASCLVLAAKSRGIPTMTMLHGVINPPYGYTPLLADKIFCWGEQQQELLVSMGVEPARAVITGCQRAHRFIEANQQAVREKVGFPIEKPLILLVTNPCNPLQRHRLAQAFCEANLTQKGYTAAVRLHPAEEVSFYQEYDRQYPDVTFMANSVWSVDEAMAAADVIVCHDSGFGSDALIKGKPVIVFDVLDSPLSSSKELVEKAGCPKVRSASDLTTTIERILSDDMFRAELKKSTEVFVSYFCAAFGDEAARNTAHQIEYHAKDILQQRRTATCLF